MENNWYYINTGFREGSFNMAFDMVLCRESLEYPVLRLFGWQPYAISLGYLQKIDDVKIQELNEIGLVRRPTGGRAVFHSEEVTYSVVIPRNHSLYKKSNAEIYRMIHIALNDALNEKGVPTNLENRDTPYKKLTEKPVCFSSKARSEVQFNGRKIIGSAQRRLKEALLQHGSILIGNYHLNIVNYLKGYTEKDREVLRKMSISVEEITGKKIDFDKFIEEIKASFESNLNIDFHNLENLDLLVEDTENIKEEFNLLVNK